MKFLFFILAIAFVLLAPCLMGFGGYLITREHCPFDQAHTGAVAIALGIASALLSVASIELAKS